MKQLLAIVLASAALTVFAAEPTAPAEAPKSEMKLAKKKADKEAEAKAAKASPTEKAVQAREDSRDKAMAQVAGVKEAAPKADTKSQAPQKAEAPKK